MKMGYYCIKCRIWYHTTEFTFVNLQKRPVICGLTYDHPVIYISDHWEDIE